METAGGVNHRLESQRTEKARRADTSMNDADVGFRCRCEGREIAALLCRELTNASLGELSSHN